MSTKIQLAVYRRLDNRNEGFTDDSSRALELHNRRKTALHAVLDNEQAWHVADWGLTDDTQSHELVELAVELITNPQIQAIGAPALTFISGILTTVISAGTAEVVKALIERLRHKQQQNQIFDFTIKADGVSIECYPQGADAEIKVVFKNGQVTSLQYNATASEVPQMGHFGA